MTTSLADRLESFFRSRPSEWVDGRELARIAGAYGWRTRCSDLRKRGMDIQNRCRRVKLPTGQTVTVSEYRFNAPSGQLALL
jgi:hypothetical protein